MSREKLTTQEKSWILYDVGTSAYMMIACSLIPIWFKDIAVGTGPGQISSDHATAFFSLALSVMTVFVAFLGPICGALADRKDAKKLFFTTSMALGAILCILSGFIEGWLLFLVVYVATRTTLNVSVTFYDSMLNDVTTEERMDEVSSYGYAWGYVGSCVPFIAVLSLYVLGGGISDDLMVISPATARILGFALTGVWWFAASIPLIKNYRQVNYVDERHGSILAVFRRLGRTCKKIALYDKKVLYFLLAFFLYIDGVDTIINNAINVGTDLGLPEVGQVVFLLLTQIVAFVGALVFARLSRRFDAATLIQVCIVGYFFVCLYALTMHTLIQFGILAFSIGCFQGSIQSLSRSYYSKIIPPENSGEYFGIYDIFCKGASFFGSAILAWVKLAGGTINIALASLAIFFVFGFFLLRAADRQPSAR